MAFTKVIQVDGVFQLSSFKFLQKSFKQSFLTCNANQMFNSFCIKYNTGLKWINKEAL